ncbi:hypothetical protein M405DRAFT_808034, partial [Rhizopogon salebrosus TDB-379]
PRPSGPPLRHTAVLYNGKIYIFRGRNGHDVFDDGHLLDLAGAAYYSPIP